MIRNGVLVVDEGEISDCAREILKSSGVDFKEVYSSDGRIRPYWPRVQRPTLLVQGRIYDGIERIKDLVYGMEY